MTRNMSTQKASGWLTDRTDPGPNGGRGVLGTGVYVLYVPPSSASPTGANAPRRGGRARADTQKLEIRKLAVIRERSYRAPSDTKLAQKVSKVLGIQKLAR